MRSEDMVVGGFYALRSTREADVKVRVLETPPEVTRAARVKVRFESGVKTGAEANLPSRRIYAPWAERDQPRSPRRARPGKRLRAVEVAPTDDPRAFTVGADVTLPEETRDLIWEIASIHDSAEPDPMATIVSDIFGQRQERTVALHALRAMQTPRRYPDRALDFDYEEEFEYESPYAVGSAVRPPVDLSPEKPERELDEAVRNVLFLPDCLAFYHRRFVADTPWQDRNDTLREEIRRKGFLEKGEPAGAWGRIRVQGRFDVVLDRKPRDVDPCSINHLVLPRRKQAKKQPQQRRRRGGSRKKAA